MADFTTKSYAPWLEGTFRELVDIDPVSIAMEMIDADGQLYTCYWNTSRDGRAQMIGGMQDDDLLDLLRNNRDAILEILNDEEVDDDGLCEADT